MGTKPPGNKVYAKVDSSVLTRLLKSPPVAVFSHWVFQSLLYIDKTERRFKLALDAIGTLVVYLLFQLMMPDWMAILVSFVIAHTLNFVCNAQLWGVLKGYGYVHFEPDEFDHYVEMIVSRAKKEKSLQKLLVYGSISRGERDSGSDFDARIIREP